MRTFISLQPDPETKKRISEIQRRVKQEISENNKNFLNSIKWEAEDKFHMTLFFIGEIDEVIVNQVRSKLTETQKESIGLEMKFSSKGINAFPKLRYPRVLIIDLKNPDNNVFTLSEKITSKLKEIELYSDKKFHPHITIGRVKRDHKLNLSGMFDKIDTELEFILSDFLLMKSDLKSSGSEYSVLEKFDLK